MKWFFWSIWAVISFVLAAYFISQLLFDPDKSDFLIGQTSYGHYQIEMACTQCHAEPFGGSDVLQNACIGCHAAELEEAHDSHPKNKFTDPREAYRLEILDARYCVTCHTEHKHEQTREMGVTLPNDYCYHCHTDVVEERESHRDLAFDSCASAGCHNFHDNRALYESFLVENAHQPWLVDRPLLDMPNYAFWTAAKKTIDKAASKPDYAMLSGGQWAVDNTAPDSSATIIAQWHASSHAHSGVNCSDCHQADSTSEWLAKPGLTQCQTCHQTEAEGFLSGKHGMQLALAMTTATINGNNPSEQSHAGQTAVIEQDKSSLSFHQQGANIQHGCNTCHSAHSFDTRKSAVTACLECHDDKHSNAYGASPHADLWRAQLAGELPQGSGVSCATCHMPRIEAGKVGMEVAVLNSEKDESTDVVMRRVQHNQNWNLRPNEKMIRSVCMQCHSLEFSIDALADKQLIENNFLGKPSRHIESIDWAVRREQRP